MAPVLCENAKRYVETNFKYRSCGIYPYEINLESAQNFVFAISGDLAIFTPFVFRVVVLTYFVGNYFFIFCIRVYINHSYLETAPKLYLRAFCRFNAISDQKRAHIPVRNFGAIDRCNAFLGYFIQKANKDSTKSVNKYPNSNVLGIARNTQKSPKTASARKSVRTGNVQNRVKNTVLQGFPFSRRYAY